MFEVTVWTFAESPNVERALDVLEVEGGSQHARHLLAPDFLLGVQDLIDLKGDLIFVKHHFFDFFLKKLSSFVFCCSRISLGVNKKY